MNVVERNREAWNRESREGSEWAATPLDRYSPVAIATRAIKQAER